MFSRGSNSELPKPPLPPTASEPLPAPASPPALPNGNGRSSPFAPAATLGQSVIGTDLAILGQKITIVSQNKLQIDGDVRGDVHGKEVVIGEDGSVIGTVCAEAIEVRGGVRGAIKARSVMLHPTAEVEGDIFHQSLAISEGAQFDGRVRRAKDLAEVTPNLNVESYATSTDPVSG